MTPIARTAKVGDIARTWPETMKVFARYKLDLCCGGAHALDFVAEKHGLNLETLLRDLNEVVEAASPVR